MVLVALTVGGCNVGDSNFEPIVGCTYDYQPFKGPREMARASDLVVRGTIGKPRPGLAEYRTGGSRVRVETDIIPIRVTSILWDRHRRNPGALTQYGKPPVVEVEIDCEGFLLELAPGKGVRNLDLDQRFPGADLTDFYPGNRRFPPRKRGQ